MAKPSFARNSVAPILLQAPYLRFGMAISGGPTAAAVRRKKEVSVATSPGPSVQPALLHPIQAVSSDCYRVSHLIDPGRRAATASTSTSHLGSTSCDTYTAVDAGRWDPRCFSLASR